MNTAIIVAAGSGTRLDPRIPKQFIEIAGKPLIIHTIDRFVHCAVIDEIVVVLPQEYRDRFTYTSAKLTAIVAGGDHRAASVLNGLNSVNEETDIVAVHDGARPIVSESEIQDVISATVEFGAACLTAPITDTVKSVEDGRITGTVDRRRLRRALTPQAFRFELLRRAFVEVAFDENTTDECSMVEQLGVQIAAVDGDPRNIKVTHPEDLLLAEIFLKELG